MYLIITNKLLELAAGSGFEPLYPKTVVFKTTAIPDYANLPNVAAQVRFELTIPQESAQQTDAIPDYATVPKLAAWRGFEPLYPELTAQSFDQTNVPCHLFHNYGAACGNGAAREI